MTTIELTKHHGLGNDFLVCDPTQLGPEAPWAAYAKQWCDRRRGIGADGLLLCSRLGNRLLGMVLYNADGSRAEMSGNGIRCLAHAAYRMDAGASSRATTTYEVDTDAGRRSVEVRSIDASTIEASVDMGELATLPEPAGWAVIGADALRPVMHLSAGNPHTVVAVDDVRIVDLAALGQRVPDTNLEIIEAGPEAGGITMRVHDRGAGITEACGTGACASAYAAVAWGLAVAVDGEILVHMDGGDARVRLDDPAPGQVTLIGPSTHIADLRIEIP